jgi:hypothetical protein
MKERTRALKHDPNTDWKWYPAAKKPKHVAEHGKKRRTMSELPSDCINGFKECPLDYYDIAPHWKPLQPEVKVFPNREEECGHEEHCGPLEYDCPQGDIIFWECPGCGKTGYIA